MTAPFRHVTIPLTSGARQDTAKFAPGDPSHLSEAVNVMFARQGAIYGRPGAQSKAADVQVRGAGSVLSTFASVVGGATAAGLVAAHTPGAFGSESPLALWQGISLLRREENWLKVGEQMHVRVDRSQALNNVTTSLSTRQNPIPCGTTVAGILTAKGAASGFPYFNDENQVRYVGTGSVSLVDAASKANIAAAGSAVFYMTTSGDVRATVPNTALPTTLDLSIGSAGRTDTTPRQNIAAVLNQAGTHYYVAYVSSVAGRISIKQVAATGSGGTTGSLDVNGLGTVLGVSLAYVREGNQDKLCLLWIDTVGPTVRTKVFTVAGAVITDAAIDVSYATAPETNATFFGIAAGWTGGSSFSIMYVTSTGGCFIGGRSTSAATTTNSMTLHGRYTAFGTGLYWEPLFGAVSVAGRCLVGVARGVGLLLRRSQWVVLDVTDLYNGSTTAGRLVVAHGIAEGCDRLAVSSVGQPSSSSIAFCVPEGITFDTTGATRTASTRILLTLQPAASANGHGLDWVTGGTARYFDGAQLAAHPFPETYPFITDDTAAAAAGSLTGGSYTYQATWEMVNGKGQTIRSGASNVVTEAGVAAGQKVNVTVSVPQLVDYRAGADAISVRVRLWGTVVNPSAGAPLYAITETILTSTPAAAFVTLVHTSEVDTSGEQLYTVGSVLDDEPPPAGDRGVAFANQRLWVADQRRVYASKLLRPNIAPAWNTSGLHTFEVATSLGDVEAIVGMDDRLLVLCSAGALQIFGPGLDDLGNGPGWSAQAIPVHRGCAPSPRAACAIPDGVTYVGSDGQIYLIGRDMSAQCISRPMRDETVTTATPCLTWVQPGLLNAELTINAMLVSLSETRQLVMDTETGQWALWTAAGVTPMTVANICGLLWGQEATDVYAYDALDVGRDKGINFTMSIRTGILTPDGQTPVSWGRVRGMTVLAEVPQVDPYDLQAILYADEAETVILNKTVNISTSTAATWPRNPHRPQFSTSQQRCQFVSAYLSAAPALAVWNAIELWVAGSPERAPTRTRS